MLTRYSSSKSAPARGARAAPPAKCERRASRLCFLKDERGAFPEKGMAKLAAGMSTSTATLLPDPYDTKSAVNLAEAESASAARGRRRDIWNGGTVEGLMRSGCRILTSLYCDQIEGVRGAHAERSYVSGLRGRGGSLTGKNSGFGHVLPHRTYRLRCDYSSLNSKHAYRVTWTAPFSTLLYST